MLLLSAGALKAQDTLVCNFVNAVYKQIINPNARYYYLFETGKSPKRGMDNTTINFSEDLRDYDNIPKGIPFEELTAAISADTSSINWHNYPLIDARVKDKAHLPDGWCMSAVYTIMRIGTPDSVIKKKQGPCAYVILVKPKASKRQKDKALKSFQDSLQNLPIEEKQWYKFSKPVFSNDKRYGLIAVNNSEGGRIYIFRHEGTLWKKVLVFDSYVY